MSDSVLSTVCRLACPVVAIYSGHCDATGIAYTHSIAICRDIVMSVTAIKVNAQGSVFSAVAFCTQLSSQGI